MTTPAKIRVRARPYAVPFLEMKLFNMTSLPIWCDSTSGFPLLEERAHLGTVDPAIGVAIRSTGVGFPVDEDCACSRAIDAAILLAFTRASVVSADDEHRGGGAFARRGAVDEAAVPGDMVEREAGWRKVAGGHETIGLVLG